MSWLALGVVLGMAGGVSIWYAYRMAGRCMDAARREEMLLAFADQPIMRRRHNAYRLAAVVADRERGRYGFRSMVSLVLGFAFFLACMVVLAW